MGKLLKSAVSIVLSALCIIISIPTAGAAFADDMLSKMTLEEKIGQMITVAVRNWDGEGMTILESEAAEIIKNNSVGGVILFSENLENTQQTVKLINDLQNAAVSSRNKIPLFVSVDQEGGAVVRLRQGTSLPGNMALGATDSEEDAEKAGDILGKELKALGFNVDFAPSLDVNSNPLNPIIGLRSYSSKPELVSKLGVKTIAGIQKNNVAAAAKHFPGHGDTSEDSHSSLPSVNKSMEEIEKCELVPFKNAVENGVDMIMTAHIQFPQIETQTVRSESTGDEIYLPATLSKTFVTDILRNKLGFNGVVTTDAMNMGAISENFGVTQACILAINAGVDILLMPVSLSGEESGTELASLIGNLTSAVKDGVIKEETINEAVRRILNLKEKRGINNYSPVSAETALAVVSSARNHETEDDIATKAITVLKNENNVLPFKPENNQKVVFVTAYGNEEANCEYAITKLISEKAVPEMDYEIYCYNEGDDTDTILNAVRSADYVFAFTEMNSMSDITPDSINTSVPKAVVECAKENNKKYVVVSIGNPYDTANYTDSAALMAAYGCIGMDSSDTDGSQLASYTYGPNIMAAIEAAFGYKNPFGVLPVDIHRIREDGSIDITQVIFPFGSGLTYANTSKPAENSTQLATAQTATAASDNNKVGKKGIIEKLQDNGSFTIVVALCVASVVVLIVIIIIAAGGKKSGKKKSPAQKT